MFNRKIKLNDQVSSTFSGYIILMNCTAESNALITIEYLVKRTDQIRTKTFKYSNQDVMYSDYVRLQKSGMY